MFKKFNKKRALKCNKLNLEEQILQLEKQLELKRNHLFEINCSISSAKNELSDLKYQYSTILSKIKEYKNELYSLEGIITMEELGLEYIPTHTSLTKLQLEIQSTQDSIGYLIGSDQAIITTRVYRIDGSEAKGRKFQKAFCENLLIGFNSYLSKKKKSITSGNIVKTKELIENKFNSINSKAALMGASINKQYLDLCLTLLTLELDQKITKDEEKERIKEEKRRLKEQEKLLAEAEKERKRLEEEKKAMNLAYNKALTEEERNKIVEQIQEIDKRIGDIDYRVANPKAGWVYVIESPSLQGMVKIGTSRRLNGPFERVRELSGSSLPEAFKINGFCFSDDAFELENNMHKYFAKQRVNPNKEFFYIAPQEAIKALKEEFGCDVHFVNEESEDEDETY